MEYCTEDAPSVSQAVGSPPRPLRLAAGASAAVEPIPASGYAWSGLFVQACLGLKPASQTGVLRCFFSFPSRPAGQPEVLGCFFSRPAKQPNSQTASQPASPSRPACPSVRQSRQSAQRAVPMRGRRGQARPARWLVPSVSLPRALTRTKASSHTRSGFSAAPFPPPPPPPPPRPWAMGPCYRRPCRRCSNRSKI